jgi:hypothetical protein
LAEQPAGGPDIRPLLILILFFELAEPFPPILGDSLDLIALKLVHPHLGSAGIPTDKPGLSIILDYIRVHKNFAVIDQHDPVAFVACYCVVLDVHYRGQGHDTVVIVADGVLSNKKLLAVQQKDTLPSG